MDINGAANAILRLWTFYKLNLTRLLDGQILDTRTDPLSAEDVLFITRYADDAKLYYEEIVWLEEFLKQRKIQDDQILKIKVARALAAAYYKVNLIFKKK